MFLSWFMGCVTAVYFIFLLFPITLPYALWNLTLETKLLVNDKITTSCPTNLLRIISKVANNKTDDFWKTHIIFAIRFNVLQFVHMHLIVLAVLFKPSLLWIVTLTFNILASACYPLVEAYFPFVNGRCIFNGPCHHWPLVTETLVENRDTREICSLNDKSRRYCYLYSLLKYSRRHLCKANLNNKYSNLRLALATVTNP